MSGPGPERLGEASAPSGVLVVVDAGLLPLWSGRRPPALPAGLVSPQATRDANRGIDFRVEGADAVEAGRRFNRQPDGRFVLDVPASAAAATRDAFAAAAAGAGLDARLVPLPARLPHRMRADLAVEAGGAGEVFFHGATAVAVAVPPSATPVPVLGRRVAAGPDAGRWREVWAEWSPAPVASSALAGRAAVAQARLALADADALDAWVADESLDGKADWVFWGHDAAIVAARTGAPDLGDGDHGWRGVDVEEALARGAEVESLAERSGYAIAWDHRPHSHHWQVLEQVRASRTASGTIDLAGARVCGFMTSWSDGLFPVWRDVDAAGALVRVRVELGADEVVARERAREARARAPS